MCECVNVNEIVCLGEARKSNDRYSRMHVNDESVSTE
jgi:hypothetical protein